MKPDIYGFIQSEESNFQTDEVRVGDNWNWNFRDHVQLIFHLKNGVFYTGSNDYLRAFKNIMEPMLNLSYWTEDIEVKDVVFYIEERTGRVLSFLVKKYYEEVYVKENNLDTFFDEVTESDLDYGGVLVQKTKDPRPEVLKLTKIAFCDQTDIMGGPIAFKHHFSPSKLRQMSKLGWGDEKNGATISIEELIVLAQNDKAPNGMDNTKNNRVPGKDIEVYIVRGDMPEAYLEDNDNMEYYCPQVQIVAFYTKKGQGKMGVTLYRKKDTGEEIKFFTSKEVDGRALGRGVGEALIHPQLWTNFLEIHKMNMLEAGSKVPLVTDDPDYTTKNRIQDMETLEITTIQEGRTIKPIQTIATANVQLFENSINTWYEHGQLSASAFDPLMGKEQSSGTTYKGQERTVAQGRGTHDRRRGQRAKFFEEVYRDMIIDQMVKDILKGKKFLATLSTQEMQWVADQLADNEANNANNELVLNGEFPADGRTFDENKQEIRQRFLMDFSKRGNQHLLEILTKEFADINIRMGINIAGKQKNLADLSDKVMGIIQAAMANPMNFQAAMKIPGMASMFNDVLEFAGISQVDFAAIASMPTPQLPQPGQPQQPQQPQPSPINPAQPVQ